MLNFCDFIQVCVFTTNHHLNVLFHFFSSRVDVREVVKNTRAFLAPVYVHNVHTLYA